MGNEELRKKILEVMQSSPMASFATILDGKPWVRYVMVHAKESMDLYFTASKLSRKVSQIQADPHCHALLGGDARDFTKSYLQVAGKAEVLEDPAVKKEFWNDYLARMFKGPDDPNYVVIRIIPKVIEFWGEGKMEPQVYTPA
ncbi:MAG: pyridoxamine 5'-phosphate oxidase family protein [Candidatus Eremiobacteraeota bacterium]|nr:pyridoxamine 5'-phosphate oxidase family protein [Candidatus Eremiobacteraeota bacterium]